MQGPDVTKLRKELGPSATPWPPPVADTRPAREVRTFTTLRRSYTDEIHVCIECVVRSIRLGSRVAYKIQIEIINLGVI
jgi:hypothetical protein